MTVNPDLELKTVTLRERFGPPVEITGYQIGQISTKFGSPEQGYDRPKQRWGMNTVYRTPSGLLVLTREAFSLMYHRHPTSCRTVNSMPYGERCTTAEMVAALKELGHELTDAVSCDRCRPYWPDELAARPATQAIRYEFPRRTIAQCPEGPGQIVQQLSKRKMFSGVDKSELPEPARALLEMCVENDDEFALELVSGPVQRIA